MQVSTTQLIDSGTTQQVFSATDGIMSAHRMTSKTRESVVHTIQTRTQRRLQEQAERLGMTIIAQTEFRWAQHTENALGALVGEDTATRYTMRPWTPGEPLLDGFVHLIVQVHGVGVGRIELEWPS